MGKYMALIYTGILLILAAVAILHQQPTDKNTIIILFVSGGATILLAIIALIMRPKTTVFIHPRVAEPIVVTIGARSGEDRTPTNRDFDQLLEKTKEYPSE